MLRKCDLNSANDGASAKASPFHALIVFKKRLSILASCMANLSKFHVVFSSSTLIRLNKDAFEEHLVKNRDATYGNKEGNIDKIGYLNIFYI